MSAFAQLIEKQIVEIESVGYYRSPPKYASLINLHEKNMYGALRVVVFFTGIFLIPCILLIIPLYLRQKIFSDISYAVTESDMIEATDGISSLFCQSQTLKMNISFNAFQIDQHKMDTEYKKHFRLRKSMSLPDDSLEYWGFFLNKGSVVNLSMCSRYKGGKVLVVKDIKDLHTCGLLEHKQAGAFGPHRLNVGENQVHLIHDTDAEVIRQNTDFEGEHFSEESTAHARPRRSTNQKPVNHFEGFVHGKTNTTDEDSSDSSFEDALLTCHDGRMLFNDNFTHSALCTSLEYLENNTHEHVSIDIHQDGYYFYIFYSDNDEATNQIHAVFNILKPTYEYSDHIRNCINQTECTFPITFWSNEKVVAEIPMKNGIDHETDEIAILISTCQPRTLMYLVFPIAVLIMILGFSFI